MRLGALACLLLGACGSPEGITLDIVATDGVVDVELFVAKRCQGSCGGMVAPPGFPRFDANLFEVEQDEIWTTSVDGGVAGFRLTADVTDPVEPIALLAAVGYAANGMPIATGWIENIDVKPGVSAYWRLLLSPAVPLDPSSPPAEGAYRIAHWETGDAKKPSCVVIEHGSMRFAIGPETDEDCDEVTQTPECAPWEYNAGAVPGSISNANCTVQAVVDADGSASCLAAAPTCSEVGTTSTCARIETDFCLAAPLCGCAPPWNAACLYDLVTNATNGTYLKCVVPTADGGVPCNNPTAFNAIDLGSYVANTASKVTGVRLHELGATIGPFDAKAEFMSSTFEITAFTAPGLVDMQWSGMADGEVALVSLDLDNGRHIILPLLLQFGPGCAMAPYCDFHFGTGDTGLACAAPSPTTNLCAPQAPCGGLMCGSNCCAAGEQCSTTGECECGANGQACPSGSTCEGGTPNQGCGSECCGGTTGVNCTF